MDPDAFDPEAFRRRQLSVERVLHNLVVAHVSTLGFTHVNTCLINSMCDILACSHLRRSLYSLKLGAPALIGPPLAKIFQAVLMGKMENQSEIVCLFLEIIRKRGVRYLCALKLVTVNKPSADHGACAS